MSESKFSIVVPTMWKFPPFINFLADLVQFPSIGEIIIINNDPENTPVDPVFDHEKIRMFTYGTNIYVNPAWNIGVHKSQNENICILNDDLIFDLKVFYHVDKVLSKDTGVIGLCFGDPVHNQPAFQNGSIKIKPWEGEHTIGFGTMMFVHKDTWIDIPDDLKVYYGDNWIFDTALWEQRPNYIITDILHYTPSAQTSKHVVGDFLEKETPIYRMRLEEWKLQIQGR